MRRMSLSRRGFFQALASAEPLPVRLSSNENPLGPGAAALRAIQRATTYAGRYPFNAAPSTDDFIAVVAKRNRLNPENVAIGAGSAEILDCAVRAFARGRGLVTADPTFERPATVARLLNIPTAAVPVDAAGRLNLDAMAEAAAQAGLVFVCNPNNPTGVLHSAEVITSFIRRVSRAAPDTIILVDEAYHEYVTDRTYATAVPLIRQHPTLVVSRTLSKAYGMAGMRLGYALGQKDAIARLSRWLMPFNGNVLVLAASIAAMQDEEGLARERRRNTEVLQFTNAFFRRAGFEAADSQANFAWVNIRRPAIEFATACEKRGIIVGRQFPPFEKTHARISIGTMEEMRRAVEVFAQELGVETGRSLRH
jgi:histidinol-phosphate aminotransferase